MPPEAVLYVANMTIIEKQDIVWSVILFYVLHHVSTITTPRKNSKTVFIFFIFFVDFWFILYVSHKIWERFYLKNMYSKPCNTNFRKCAVCSISGRTDQSKCCAEGVNCHY